MNIKSLMILFIFIVLGTITMFGIFGISLSIGTYIIKSSNNISTTVLGILLTVVPVCLTIFVLLLIMICRNRCTFASEIV